MLATPKTPAGKQLDPPAGAPAEVPAFLNPSQRATYIKAMALMNGSEKNKNLVVDYIHKQFHQLAKIDPNSYTPEEWFRIACQEVPEPALKLAAKNKDLQVCSRRAPMLADMIVHFSK